MKKPSLPLNWHALNSYLAFNIRPALLYWLKDAGSLTWRLKKHSQTFRLQVLAEGWQRPRYDERTYLKLLKNETVWIREVLLICDEQPAIYARSLFPAASLKAEGTALRKLNNRPLIEILAEDPQLQRSPIEITRATHNIYGRRSIFSFYEKKILVSEFFLSHSIFKLDNN